jgi:TolB-like protein/Flp pilus assembly protein TadD
MSEGAKSVKQVGPDAPAQSAAVPAIPERAAFITYATADEAAADSICAAPERNGIACWIAPRDIIPVLATPTRQLDTPQAHNYWTRLKEQQVALRALVYAAFGLALVLIQTNTAAANPDSAVAAFAPPAHSIAVLPFLNTSGDAKQEYFSDGISEELLNSLSRLHELQVIARTSSFSFKGQNADVSTIAHKLNVRTILEGSVRRGDNKVRVTVQLLNAITGSQMWSQTYDRKLTDILKIQTEVATSVAQQLEYKLVGDEVAEIQLGGTQNTDAYDAYLRGMQLYNMPDAHAADYRAALAAFDRAISLDRNFAAAYARRSGAFVRIYYEGADPGTRAGLQSQAREAAGRAVELAPQFGEAHLALALAYVTGEMDFTEAAREFDLALSLSPGSAWVQRNVGVYAGNFGHFKPAVNAARQAIRLDPQNVAAHEYLAWIFMNARRYSEALATMQDARALDPSSHDHDLEDDLAQILLNSGQFEKARQVCESPASPLDDEDRHFCLALAYHALRRQVEAERELKLLLAQAKDSATYIIAVIYAQWGDKPAALQWLNKAVQLRDGDLKGLKVDPLLDPIRNEPRFKAILARMHFPP